MFANILQAPAFETSTPLPTIQQAEAHCGVPNFLSAYRVCLQFEDKAVKNAEAEAKSGGASKSKGTSQKVDLQLPVIYARILGYLLYFTTSHRASADITTVIHSCHTEGRFEKLEKLGEHFLNYFIRECEPSHGALTTRV